MIDATTALDLVITHAHKCSKTLELNLMDALGHVLAADVMSPIDMPPFRQSAMDGYAVNFWEGVTYALLGEIQAGSGNHPKLLPGQSVRIFTGAAVPDSATAVVMQEKALVSGTQVRLQGPILSEMNIRPQGEQIKKGSIAMAKGTVIKAAHIGFLSGLGITKLRVAKKPSIAIVVTGNELVSPGTPLAYGKIYESNGLMLQAALYELGFKNAHILRIKDDYEQTKNVLQDTISTMDIVIITGGVSVGEYDFVGKALLAIGVEQIFYKVNQKPGKPLFFGKKLNSCIFGLPGNPGAALTCFYIYVYPLLKRYEGAEQLHLDSITMPIVADYVATDRRAQFLKAHVRGGKVEILPGQSSAMVRAFGAANALVFLPEETTQVNKEDFVKTILLPNI